MRIFALALAACVFFPSIGHAGVAGKYVLNNKKMIKLMLPQILKRVPKDKHQMVIDRIKKRASENKTWMVLGPKGSFKGYSQNSKQPKPKLGATGTWKKSGKKVTIRSVSIRNKKKQTIHCVLNKAGMECVDPRKPKLKAQFDKS